jgi:uncharacterized protein DUF4272
MGANAVIYLPHEEVSLKDLFPQVETDGGFFRKPSFYEFYLAEDLIRLNVMPSGDVKKHLAGLQGYVQSLADEEHHKSKARALIGRVRTALGLVTNATFESNHELYDSLTRIAAHFSGFLFLFNSILLPDGRVVVGPLRQAAGEKSLPVPESALQGQVRTSLDSQRSTPGQVERRARSIEVLKGLGVPYLAELPVVEEDASIIPRRIGEIAQRCVAVALCAVKGELKDQASIDRLVADFGAESFFSPREAAFIHNQRPTRQELVDHAWGYECVHVLLWSLGYLKELKPPNEVCDVPGEVAVIRDHHAEGLEANAHPRKVGELLDMADLYYHYHWSAIELRPKGRRSDALNEEIIRERHKALSWLIRYMDEDWDDVQTDT